MGITRGSSELVLLDSDGVVLAATAAPAGAVDIGRRGDTLFVVGERSASIGRFKLSEGPSPLTALGERPVPGARSLRALAIGEGGVHVADDVTGAVLWAADQGETTELTRCHGPTQLERAGDRLLINCTLDHELQIWSVAEATKLGAIRHDGPMWRFAIAADGGDLIAAIAGIEDRPLDRSVKGSFGFIDSFAFIYRIEPSGKSTRLAAVNVGEFGLVTPKWIDVRTQGPAVRVRASSYGGDRFVAMHWSDRSAAAWGRPKVSGLGEIAPGTTDIAWLGEVAIAANPLLDAWLIWRDGAWRTLGRSVVDKRSVESRLGELLFFTKLMAPFGTTEGRKSRFTCEACHFEGYVDGRTHYTGRGDVSATSRSLRGLFNNRPHFSRALDRTTGGMIDNEFRVANKLSGTDYWFSLDTRDFSWLSHLELAEELSPVYLRRALMAFLRDFTNPPNPLARGRTAFNSGERKGAALFRDRCERCHAARLIVDDPKSGVEYEQWESHIFSEAGAITWALADYSKTGITPYVHELGARPPQLRRLYKKWPYFTNGSADSLTELLGRIRFKGKTLVHQGLESGVRLTEDEVSALESFLILL